MEQSKIMLVVSAIALSLIVVIGISVLTLYTLNRPMATSTEDLASSNRLEMVNVLLQKHFGPSWAYMLIGLAILFVSLGMAFTFQGGTIINLDRTSGNATLIVLGAFFTFIALAIILGFSYLYVYKPDSTTSLEDQATRQKSFFSFSLSILILLTLSWFGGFFYRKLKK